MTLRTYTDQLGNTLTISFPPQRIISLVPSQTELLSYLGLENRVIGMTKFCVHPASWQKTKEIIGGTKNFNIERILSLKPDLIIGNKEENYKDGIEQLKLIAPVWMSDVSSLGEALTMIEQVGQLTDTSSRATSLIKQIQISCLEVEKLPNLRTLYLIWRNPWMAAAPGTFIHEMIILSGLRNCLVNDNRYPEIDKERLKTLNPEVVLLSSEPYPFQQKHLEEIETILPNSKILLVDGELFSWYGSRLLLFADYIKSLGSIVN